MYYKLVGRLIAQKDYSHKIINTPGQCSAETVFLIFTASNEVVARYCLSFCSRGGVCHPPGQTPPWADTPHAQCMLGYDQLPGGTHPTGLHSRSFIFVTHEINYD